MKILLKRISHKFDCEKKEKMYNTDEIIGVSMAISGE